MVNELTMFVSVDFSDEPGDTQLPIVPPNTRDPSPDRTLTYHEAVPPERDRLPYAEPIPQEHTGLAEPWIKVGKRIMTFQKLWSSGIYDVDCKHVRYNHCGHYIMPCILTCVFEFFSRYRFMEKTWFLAFSLKIGQYESLEFVT